MCGGQLPPIEAHDVLVKSGGMSQILLWYKSTCFTGRTVPALLIQKYKYLHLKRRCRTSFLEIFGGIALFQTIQGKRYPGDFQFDPLGLSQVPLRSSFAPTTCARMCHFFKYLQGPLCLSFLFLASFFYIIFLGGGGGGRDVA